MANSYTKPILMEIPDDACGPAMRELTQKQRKFVLAWRNLGGGRNKATQAARDAGYSDVGGGAAVSAYRLMHDKKVILALDEECRGALASASTMITERLMQFAEEEPDNKLRLKALLEVADRIGYHAVQEHKVVTQDVSKTDDALVARLRQLVQNNPDNIKLVPKELLPQLEFKPGVVVDAEFSEVEPVAVDPDADLLGE